MARWVGEETIEELAVQVTVQVPLREVTLEAAALRSPGGTKPMRRRYQFIPTPDAAAVCSKAYGDRVHAGNMASRAAVDAEFDAAEKQQCRINAR